MTTMTTMTTRERAAELLAAATERAAAQGAEPDGVECALAATVVALSDELRDARDDLTACERLLAMTEETAEARDAALTAEVARLRALLADESGPRVEARADALKVLAIEAPSLAADLLDARDELTAARRAAALAEAERDVLRELTDGMRVDNVRLRAIVAGRSTAPTDAEIAAHTRAGGVWLVTWEAIAGAGLLDGPAAVRAADSARRGGYAVPVTRWVAVLDGRPTAWPTTGDAAGEAGRATGGDR